MIIYHVVERIIWEKFAEQTFFEAESLRTEGFIHCSFPDQLDGVIKRYFAGVSDVVVLSIDADRLIARLVSEPSTNGEHFPHIYGAINRDAIISAELRHNGG